MKKPSENKNRACRKTGPLSHVPRCSPKPWARQTRPRRRVSSPGVQVLTTQDTFSIFTKPSTAVLPGNIHEKPGRGSRTWGTFEQKHQLRYPAFYLPYLMVNFCVFFFNYPPKRLYDTFYTIGKMLNKAVFRNVDLHK